MFHGVVEMGSSRFNESPWRRLCSTFKVSYVEPSTEGAQAPSLNLELPGISSHCPSQSQPETRNMEAGIPRSNPCIVSNLQRLLQEKLRKTTNALGSFSIFTC